MEVFADGTKIIFVVLLRYADPERVLGRALRKTCGKNFHIFDPRLNRQEYEKAFEKIRARLDKGDHMVCWDWDKAQVSFYTPQRKNKAWSAWIRVVDISSMLYN